MPTSSTARMIYLHALTPVHTGTGQAAAVIDLPIAREKATGWPVIPASGLKGVLREALDPQGEGRSPGSWVWRAFGPPTENASDSAGALCFTDQRILCLPIRSFFGTFAHVTCPLVLARLLRDCRTAGVGVPFTKLPAIETSLEVRLPEGRQVLAQGGKVYLEDLDLRARPCATTLALAQGLARALFPEDTGEQEAFSARLAVVSDNVFGFLCETATEVTARVRLSETEKKVARGGLWYEEAVPAETVFYGPVVVAGHAAPQAAELLLPLKDLTVQIGGKASVGRGLCALKVRS